MNEDPNRWRWENLPAAIFAGSGLLFCALPLLLLAVVFLWIAASIIF